MKIFLIVDSLGGGGAERVSSIWSKYWTNNGNEVTFVIISKGNELFNIDKNIKKIYLPSLSPYFFKNINRIWHLRKILKREKPDLLISLTTGPNLLSIVANFFLKIRLIITEHTFPPMEPLSIFKRILKKYLSFFCSEVIVLTEDSKKWFENNCYAKKIRIIHNPIEVPIPSSDPLLRVPKKDSKIILNCGRLSYEKGHDLLIESFKFLADDFPDWKLFILGEGKERTTLENIISDYGLSKRIFLPGWAGNLDEWYKYADIFAFSSRFEGFGNALAEAKMYGIPCVSFNCTSGPKEIINDGFDGFLVKPENHVDMANSLKALMENPKLREEISNNAISSGDKFSVSTIMRKWDNAIQSKD